MDALRLRFPHHERDDLVLSQGVHAIGRDAEGRPMLVDDPATALVEFCVDRRGGWLQLREGTRGVHVNGRPVRRMAMLRAGDAIFLDGIELVLLGPVPSPAPAINAGVDTQPRADDSRTVLRGVGGLHHGRSFSLGQPREVGRAPDCDIRINQPTFAAHHAVLEPHGDGVVLRDLGSRDGSVVNGHPVRDALLRPGDQVVFDAHHRFVIEAPTQAAGQLLPSMPDDDGGESSRDSPSSGASRPASTRRMPWLLVAALLLAAALSLLLMYGSR